MEAPEKFYGLFSLFGYMGPAASLAPGGQLDKRLVSLPVHGIYQVPGMTVCHFHGLGGLCNGAALADPLEQDHAAVTDERTLWPVDPDAAAKAGRRFA